MKNANLLSLAMGSVVAVTTLTSAVAAEQPNPFVATALEKGYQVAQTDKKADGKCGEGKCGTSTEAEKQAKHEKKADGKCGDSKGAPAAEKTDKKTDGKCASSHR